MDIVRAFRNEIQLRFNINMKCFCSTEKPKQKNPFQILPCKFSADNAILKAFAAYFCHIFRPVFMRSIIHVSMDEPRTAEIIKYYVFEHCAQKPNHKNLITSRSSTQYDCDFCTYIYKQIQIIHSVFFFIISSSRFIKPISISKSRFRFIRNAFYLQISITLAINIITISLLTNK